MLIQLRAFEIGEPLDKTIDFDDLPKLYITSGIVCLTIKVPSNILLLLYNMLLYINFSLYKYMHLV